MLALFNIEVDIRTDAAAGLHEHKYLTAVNARVKTMHDAKGAEFRAVAIPCLSHDVIPDEMRLLSARDEGHLDELMTTQRHLLYAAATRANDYLWMSGVEPVSELLPDLADQEAS